MGCFGGFEAFGLVGVVVGPVVLALARELWEQRMRDLDLAEVKPPRSTDAASRPASCPSARALSREPLSRSLREAD
jgi:hypothetical protein